MPSLPARFIAHAGVAVLFAAIAPDSSHAQGACATETVQAYLTHSSCTFGGVQYSGFQYSSIWIDGSAQNSGPASSAWLVTPTTTLVNGLTFTGFTLSGSGLALTPAVGTTFNLRDLGFSYDALALGSNTLNAFFSTALNPSASYVPPTTGTAWLASARASAYLSDATHFAYMGQGIDSFYNPAGYTNQCPWTSGCVAATPTAGPQAIGLPGLGSVFINLDLLTQIQSFDGNAGAGQALADIQGGTALLSLESVTAPEPSSFVLFACGLIALLCVVRVRPALAGRLNQS